MRILLSISIVACCVAAAPSRTAAEDASKPAEQVDLELLEYLGGLVFGEDGWVGPEDMVAVPDGAIATKPVDRAPREPDAFDHDLQEGAL